MKKENEVLPADQRLRVYVYFKVFYLLALKA